MAMTVLNNVGTMMTLGELNKNITAVGKQLSKVSSGMRITSAKDDASGFSISEKMRVQIRGLNQDVANAATGSAMLKVAAGGIENIVEELRSLKELALNAANDHNSALDRATLQRDFDQKVANIEDIANTTAYNGKPLLDGRYDRLERLDVGTEASTGVTEPSGSAATIPSGDYTISASGIYVLPAGYTGTITISDGLAGVKLQQEDPSVVLNEVYIDGPAEGKANLWLDGLNVKNSATDKSFVRFHEDDNVLTLSGDNYLQATGTITAALVHIGNGLTIEGEGGLDVAIPSLASSLCEGAVIGTDRGEMDNFGSLTVNSGNFHIDVPAGGALLGSGSGGAIGDIVIDGGTFYLSNMYYSAGIGSGYGGATAGNITIENADLTIYTDESAGIGSGPNGSYVGNITINRSNLDVHAKTLNVEPGDGAAIGSGKLGHAGNIVITNSWLDVSSEEGEPIGKGKDGTVGTVVVESCGNPLTIHTGTKASQAQRCYIKDMRLAALGLDDIHLVTKLGNSARQEVRTAIARVDRALEYALGQATTVGAYLSRLEYTSDNLTISGENTQGAESTLRDSDMAKEMVAYTKANVITQASQSMLAQANQNLSSVLSLLQ